MVTDKKPKLFRIYSFSFLTLMWLCNILWYTQVYCITT